MQREKRDKWEEGTNGKAKQKSNEICKSETIDNYKM